MNSPRFDCRGQEEHCRTPSESGEYSPWPLAWDINDALERLRKVLSSSCWTIRGPHDTSATEQFEQQWAEYCGTKFALLVPSGSSALEIALQALGVRRGDEVIVPALGWYATTAAVLRVGAKPVFADIDPGTGCLTVGAVGASLTARTAAIIVVHLHGSVGDMDQLLQLAQARGLPLIEDAAQAHGAEYAGKKVGSLGQIGCFSFNQEKLLSAGEGGAVVTNDPELFDRLYAIRTDGYRRPSPPWEPHEPYGKAVGRNLCVSEFVAAILLSQFQGFEILERIRQENAQALSIALGSQVLARPLGSSPGTTRQARYEFGFFLETSLFNTHGPEQIGTLLSKRAGFPIHLTDGYPWKSPNMPLIPCKGDFTGATFVKKHLLVFHHRILLSHKIPDRLTSVIKNLIRELRA